MMILKKYADENFSPSTSTTRSWCLQTLDDELGSNFNCAIISLLPGQESFAHKHHDAETFTILQGEALVNSDGQKERVSFGDVIHFKPFSRHSIKNISTTLPLVYQTIWWEPKVQYIQKNIQKKSSHDLTLIFSALPTPNGDLHLGHLSGPYLIADILYRYNLTTFQRVEHYFGVDSHQSYVTYKARLLKKSVADTLFQYQAEIKETLKRAGISANHNVRDYISETNKLFNALLKNNAISLNSISTAYCKNCDAFQHEAFITGLCKTCQTQISGAFCENCFSYNDETDVLNARCNVCKGSFTWIDKERYVFKLTKFKQPLTHFYHKTLMPEFAKKYCYTQIEKLKDIVISHYGQWGIEIRSVNNRTSIYSVLDLAARYLTLIEENQHNYETIKVIQCFGVDNMFNRLVLIPALLLAYNPNFKLPDTNIVNHFYLLNGKKFSTSKGHILHIENLLKDYNLDSIRYYLSYTRPEIQETDFTYKQLESTIEELAKKWENCLDALSKISYHRDLILPGTWNDSQKNFYAYLLAVRDQIKQHYETSVSPVKKVCLSFLNLLDELTYFLETQLPLFQTQFFESECRTTIYLSAVAIKSLAILIQPIMPDFAKHVLDACGVKEPFFTNDIFEFKAERIDNAKLYYKWKRESCFASM